MKPYKYLLLFIPLFSALACSKEIGEDPKGPVALNPGIAGVSLITRGGAAGATDITSLGIYAVNKTSGETTYGNAPEGTYRFYKLEAGQAKPNDADNTLWLNPEKATIFSFHPALASPAIAAEGNATTPVPTIPVPVSAITLVQSTIAVTSDNDYDFAKAENDYMYGVAYDATQTPEANKFLTTQPIANNGRDGAATVTNQSGPTIAIGLKHAFAQIRFEIKKHSTYQGTAGVTIVEYKRSIRTLSADANAPTTMNLTNGVLNNPTVAAETTYSYTFNTAATVTNDKPIKITNYVIPNDASSSELSITVDGKKMTMPYSGDPAWEAGNIYTYTIIINPTGLTLDGFNITGWNDESLPDVNV